MNPETRAKLARAILAGLTTGAGIGAGGLLLHAWKLQRVRCDELSAAECALEQTIATDLARWQLLTAFALCLLAVACLLVLRARLRGTSGGNR